MIIDRIWPGNAWRNFHYLIACSETGEAMAVDPLDWQSVHAAALRNGWTITHILNTHEHGDHIGGNDGLRAATGARVLPSSACSNCAITAGSLNRAGRPRRAVKTRSSAASRRDRVEASRKVKATSSYSPSVRNSIKSSSTMCSASSRASTNDCPSITSNRLASASFR